MPAPQPVIPAQNATPRTTPSTTRAHLSFFSFHKGKPKGTNRQKIANLEDSPPPIGLSGRTAAATEGVVVTVISEFAVEDAANFVLVPEHVEVPISGGTVQVNATIPANPLRDVSVITELPD